MKFLALATLLLLVAPPARAAQPVRTIAVLPLAAADPGMPYGLLAAPSELATMTSQLRGGLRASGVPLVVRARSDAAVVARGFDQTVPIRACVVANCAQRIGHALHADVVVVGSVTRAMAVIWGTQFTLVDVRSGKAIAEMNVGYKGDVQAMERGEWDAGGCLARLLQHRTACPPDPGW